MEDSILGSIKKLLGIADEYDVFDTDIIIHINSCISILDQLGYPVGIDSITGDDETWSDLIGADVTKFNHIKEYIYLKTKMLFDPPQNSSLIASTEKLINECEYRIFVVSDVEKKTT